MTEIATSIFGCAIHLSDERWSHIAEGHPEVESLKPLILQAIHSPKRVVAGSRDEYLALLPQGRGCYVIVAVVENNDENFFAGFVVTAWIISKMNYINSRDQLWP